MPIRLLDLTSSPGHLIQVCAKCGYKQRINLDRGAACTKDGPFVLSVDDTLDVAVDGGAPQTATFTAGTFPDFAAIEPSQLRDALNAALTGVACRLDEAPECVVIESASSGPSSKIVIVGGTALGALGFLPNDPASGRPMLGFLIGGVKLPDSILLRRCHGCTPGTTSHEIVKRTWDAMGETETAFSQHRRAANALARHLKTQGMVHPDLAADYAAEAEDPSDYVPGADTTVIEVPLPHGVVEV